MPKPVDIYILTMMDDGNISFARHIPAEDGVIGQALPLNSFRFEQVLMSALSFVQRDMTVQQVVHVIEERRMRREIFGPDGRPRR